MQVPFTQGSGSHESPSNTIKQKFTINNSVKICFSSVSLLAIIAGYDFAINECALMYKALLMSINKIT